MTADDETSLSDGEPGGVVLRSRMKIGLDGSSSLSLPLSFGGVGGVKLMLEKIEAGAFGGVACLTVGESGVGCDEVVASSSSSSSPSSSSSSTSGGTSSSSLPKSSSSDLRNASIPSSTSSSSSCDRKEMSAPSSSSSSSSSASASSSSSLPANA